MNIVLAFTWFLMVPGCVASTQPDGTATGTWERIRSLVAKGTADNPELMTHLKSLRAQEMLTAAREACESIATQAHLKWDAPPEGAAEMAVMLCLHYYFEKTDREQGGSALLKVVANRGESPFLRRALISRMHERDEPFDAEFQACVQSNKANVTALLTRILKDKEEPWLVREESMDYLAHQITTEVGKIIRGDPNAHAAWERTHTFAFVGKMLRSGELTLTEDTLKALKPLEERTIAYARLLGTILADEENEPEELRKQVKRRLEGYRESPLTGIDGEVERALRETGE